VWLLWLLAFLLQSEHRWFYRNWHIDEQAQLSAAYNFLANKGFTLSYNFPSQAENILYKNCEGFTPSYSFLAALLYPLTKNWLLSSFLLHSLGIALILGGIYGIIYFLNQKKIPHYTIPLGLFLAFSPSPFHYLGGNDLLTLGVYLMGTAFAFSLTQSKSWLNLFLALGLLSLSIWFRYAYLPFAYLPMLIPFIYPHSPAKKRLSLLSLLIIPLNIFSYQSIFQLEKIQQASFGQASTPQYFHHLFHTDSFPLKALFYYSDSLLAGIQGISNSLFYLVFYGSIFASILILGFFVYRCIFHFSRESSNLLDALIVSTSGLIWAMLAWFSITHAPHTWLGRDFWTFVMETRYYAPAMVLILIGIWQKGSENSSEKQNYFTYYFRLLIIASLCMACSFPLWIKVKNVLLSDREGTFQKSVVYQLDSIARAHPPQNAWLYSADMDSWQMGMYGATTLEKDSLLKIDSFPYTKPLELWVIKSDSTYQTIAEKKWLERHPANQKITLTQGALFIYKFPNP